MGKTFKTIDEAVIRFAGDSGDGMQLTGGRFTETTAIVGNDLAPSRISLQRSGLQRDPWRASAPFRSNFLPETSIRRGINRMY